MTSSGLILIPDDSPSKKRNKPAPVGGIDAVFFFFLLLKMSLAPFVDIKMFGLINLNLLISTH